MITKIDAEKRYFGNFDWLKTYHLFSFAEYYDPKNQDFGSLIVFNDDVVSPQTGFSSHKHENMEIITIVLEGELTHEDSLGNCRVIKAGEVQTMSAGTGVVHSEMNFFDQPTHFYQIWIIPSKEGLTPEYQQRDFSLLRTNFLTPVASGLKPNTLSIKTEATVYIGELETGKKIEYTLGENRGIFIYVREGALDINGTIFKASDQARIKDEESINLIAHQNAKFILIDVPIKF